MCIYVYIPCPLNLSPEAASSCSELLRGQVESGVCCLAACLYTWVCVCSLLVQSHARAPALANLNIKYDMQADNGHIIDNDNYNSSNNNDGNSISETYIYIYI